MHKISRNKKKEGGFVVLATKITLVSFLLILFQEFLVHKKPLALIALKYQQKVLI